jgi:hypothetical protein
MLLALVTTSLILFFGVKYFRATERGFADLI